MRDRLTNGMIAALLMFQFVIAMQWQVAHANIAPPERQASGVDELHCSGHSSPHTHDCCGSLDCECHCAQGPGVLDLTLASVVCPASFLLPFFDARSPVARSNELFRPPIA
jgi:hypothetical protein